MTGIVERLRNVTEEDAYALPWTFGETCREAADEIERLRAALEWYANPEIYRPHPHGPAFDRRDLSWHARAVLAAGEQTP